MEWTITRWLRGTEGSSSAMCNYCTRKRVVEILEKDVRKQNTRTYRLRLAKEMQR